jgi:predicted unusual protein kinase regulating ubiquinone biosynthesis (AarF/ABC1/UbiB family)
VLVALRHSRRRALRRPLPASAFARPLRLTFERLGATYVKFGQLVASSPGVFGDEVADEFRSSLDTGPAVPFAAVRAAVEEPGEGLAGLVLEVSDPTAAAGALHSLAPYRRARLDAERCHGVPISVRARP